MAESTGARKRRRRQPIDRLVEAVGELERVKQQAREMGLFAEERDLLECPQCGLWEDVTCDGLLITYPKDDEGMADSGLRFREVNEGTFQCPACGTEFLLPLTQEAIEEIDPGEESIIREREERYG